MIFAFNSVSEENKITARVIDANGRMVSEKKHAGGDVVVFLHKNKKILESCDVISPVVGVGRFSAVRAAVTAANTYALAAGMHACETEAAWWDDPVHIARHCSKTHANSASRFAKPSYQSPPRITQPKIVVPNHS